MRGRESARATDGEGLAISPSPVARGTTDRYSECQRERERESERERERDREREREREREGEKEREREREKDERERSASMRTHQESSQHCRNLARGAEDRTLVMQ